jgi:hypothetical protein
MVFFFLQSVGMFTDTEDLGDKSLPHLPTVGMLGIYLLFVCNFHAMNFFFLSMTLSNSAGNYLSWTTYAWVSKDLFLFFPNALGLLCSTYYLYATE